MELKLKLQMTMENYFHDGKAFGNLWIKGPWICSGYLNISHSEVHDNNGWFLTGDVASIDKDGFMLITDRVKDVIKSGGEWISSIQVENIAVGHEKVLEAAVIGAKHISGMKDLYYW